MRTIALAHVHPTELDGFDITKLSGPKYFRVLKIVEHSQQHVVLALDDGELANPDTDPLIVGTVRRQIVGLDGVASVDYQARVLWNNQLWYTLDEDTEELYGLLMGISTETIRKFTKRLKPRPLNDT